MIKQHLIAVIDDDESFREALVESLGSLDYGVRAFASAEEFLAANGVSSYDCIITDIHMPGMSGIDLKRQLAVRECRVPVIMITGRLEAGLASRATSSGAIGLLVKPFQTEALLGCLEGALRG